MRSSLDVGLGDGIADDEYLGLLERHVSEILQDCTPDIVFYLAGVDPARGDRYGRLALSDEGVRRRDRHVLEACQIRGLPVVVTLAGGYAATPERTAELHAIVFREAAALLRSTRREMIAGLDIPSIHGTDPLRPSSE
jgi:acetoin utilization deacetylase AcuC-like enzyme